MPDQGPNPADLFQKAAAHTRAALAGVQDGQLKSGTPCTEWDVEELRDHIIGGASLGASAFGGSAPEGGDAVSTYDAATRAAAEGMGSTGAMDKAITTPGGTEMSGAQFATLLAMDNLVHGWDLAKATGQSTDLPKDLAEIIFAGFEPMMEMLREGGGFGPPVAVSDGASAQDKLIGMMGRQP